MSKTAERADEEPRTHLTSVALSRPPAEQVDAGTDIVLKIKVSCPYGCDLRGRVINVMALDGAVVAGSGLADFADNANETTEFAFLRSAHRRARDEPCRVSIPSWSSPGTEDRSPWERN